MRTLTSKSNFHVAGLPVVTFVHFFHRWNIFYPIYFDSTKSIQEGRKLGMLYCVRQPDALDLYLAATKHLGLTKVLLESDKRHPKDSEHYGRIRVDLEVAAMKSKLILCTR